ncbi:hypothetical protein RFI_11969 [Reticulomyxa filosa]|uniref:Uncharacterized protein n=1 Tax=Reticulomyxa filosa TaxID=46433 RepID=X6NHE7_RETFI|nr:hypothetical protein RFI_11969 [Reticulomyxa filosa]|eukprot:ETO25174.1 hypothetical protein RFI_11969 [Reticulomyxa filosa]
MVSYRAQRILHDDFEHVHLDLVEEDKEEQLPLLLNEDTHKKANEPSTQKIHAEEEEEGGGAGAGAEARASTNAAAATTAGAGNGAKEEHSKQTGKGHKDKAQSQAKIAQKHEELTKAAAELEFFYLTCIAVKANLSEEFPEKEEQIQLNESPVELYKIAQAQAIEMCKFDIWIESRIREKYSLPQLQRSRKFKMPQIVFRGSSMRDKAHPDNVIHKSPQALTVASDAAFKSSVPRSQSLPARTTDNNSERMLESQPLQRRSNTGKNNPSLNDAGNTPSNATVAGDRGTRVDPAATNLQATDGDGGHDDATTKTHSKDDQEKYDTNSGQWFCQMCHPLKRKKGAKKKWCGQLFSGVLGKVFFLEHVHKYRSG